MNRWNWVLLSLIVVMVFPNLYYLLQVWSAEKNYRTVINRIDPGANGPLPADATNLGELHEMRKKSEEMLRGTRPERDLASKSIEELGITELQAKLQNILADRKQAWFGCAISENPSTDNPVNPSIDPGGDQKPLQLLSLTLRAPQGETEEAVKPFDANGTVYLFAEDADGEEDTPVVYLGAYTVVNPAPGSPNLSLLSTEEFNDAEVDKVRDARAQNKSISVYSILPLGRDLSYYAPTGETTGEVPAGDGEEAPTAGLGNDSAVKNRDFEVLFTAAYRRRYELGREIRKHDDNVKALTVSLEKAEADGKALDAEKALYEKRIAAMQVQRDTTDQKCKEIDALIKQLNRRIEETRFQNEEYVAKIAEGQKKVKDIIEQNAEHAASNLNIPK